MSNNAEERINDLERRVLKLEAHPLFGDVGQAMACGLAIGGLFVFVVMWCIGASYHDYEVFAREKKASEARDAAILKVPQSIEHKR